MPSCLLPKRFSFRSRVCLARLALGLAIAFAAKPARAEQGTKLCGYFEKDRVVEKLDLTPVTSSDGKRIYYIKSGIPFVVNLDDGSEKRIETCKNATDADESGDGKRLLVKCRDGNSSILDFFDIGEAGEHRSIRSLKFHKEDAYDVAPDFGQVATVRNSGPEFEAFWTDVATGKSRRLGKFPGPTKGIFTGTTIVFPRAGGTPVYRASDGEFLKSIPEGTINIMNHEGPYVRIHAKDESRQMEWFDGLSGALLHRQPILPEESFAYPDGMGIASARGSYVFLAENSSLDWTALDRYSGERLKVPAFAPPEETADGRFVVYEEAGALDCLRRHNYELSQCPRRMVIRDKLKGTKKIIALRDKRNIVNRGDGTLLQDVNIDDMAALSLDERFLLVHRRADDRPNTEFEFHELASGKITLFRVPPRKVPSFFPEMQILDVVLPAPKSSMIESTEFFFRNRHPSVQISGRGDVAVIPSMSGVFVADLRNGKGREIPMPWQKYHSLRIADDGRSFRIAINNTMHAVFDIETGAHHLIPATQSHQGENLLAAVVDGDHERNEGFSLRLASARAKCVANDLRLAPAAMMAWACRNPLLRTQSLGELEPAEVASKILCDLPFDRAAWERAAGNWNELGKSVPGEVVELYFRRFQKPGGLEIPAHLPILLAILRSPMPHARPAEFAAILLNVAKNYPQTYDLLLQQNPRILAETATTLAAPAGPGASEPICRAAAETKEIESALSAYLAWKLELVDGRMGSAELEFLRPLAPEIARLDKGQQHSLREKLAGALMRGMTARLPSPLRDVGTSKLQRFAYNSVAPLFGKEIKVMTDLTDVRYGPVIEPVLVASHAIDGDRGTATNFGVFMRKLEAIQVPPDLKRGALVSAEKHHWQVSGRDFNAELEVRVADIDGPTVNIEPGPRYAEHVRGKRTAGIVISGTNLRSIGSSVLSAHKIFLTHDQGFEFPPYHEAKPIKNLRAFLEEQITGANAEAGQSAWLFKEAHSDGDEKNIFRLDREGLLLTGERTRPDGIVEQVHVIFPVDENTDSTLISNAEFGEWIRERRKNGLGQFVYFNASCNSFQKAIREITAARTIDLLNIATKGSVSVFRNQPENIGFLLLDQFLKRANYAQMRKAMEANPEYKAGTNEMFLLPGDTQYDHLILQAIETPLDIPIKLRDAAGKPYSVEQERLY